MIQIIDVISNLDTDVSIRLTKALIEIMANLFGYAIFQLLLKNQKKWPNEHAVDSLMKEFGFRQKVTDKNAKLIVWLENENDFTKPQAVNVAERYDED